MKVSELLKNEKFLCFVGGALTATYGVKLAKSEKTRKACVSGLAKCMKLQNDAAEVFKNMREEAEYICYDAKQAASEETAE